MKVVYMCRTEFENGGGGVKGGSGPSVKMGGFHSGSSLKNEGILELKITKKRIFLIGRSFGEAQVGKLEQTNVCF